MKVLIERLLLKTSTQRVQPLIRAMWLFYYEYLGIQNFYVVKLSTEPASCRPTSKLQLKLSYEKKIHIFCKQVMTEVAKNGDHVNSSANENLIQVMITIYPTTGLIEVQRNVYQSFVASDFLLLLKCVNKMIIDQQFSNKNTKNPKKQC